MTGSRDRTAPEAALSFDELRAEGEHLRLAQEAGGIGTWEWDLATGRMTWSAQMFRNLGLEPHRDECLYETLLSATHPEDRKPVEASFAEAGRRVGPVRIELRAVWPGGDIHWIVFLGRVVGDASDRPVRMLGITIDGTRRRQGEAATRELAERLRLAMIAGKLATWEADLAGRVIRWSPDAAAMHGLARDTLELSFAQWERLVDPEDAETCRATFATAIAQPSDRAVEYRVLRPGADPRWVSAQGSMVLDGDGRPSRVFGVLQDVTERKSAEVALRESERRLRELNERLEQLAEQRARQLDASRAQLQAFFENSPDWLTLFRATADGRFVYEGLNRATQLAYGLNRDQVIGHSVEEVLGADQAQLPLRHMRACFRTGENRRYTARRTMAGTTRTIDVMFARVSEKHAGAHFIIATARDITEREEMGERLRQSQKIEAVGQLTGGLAHDFNNLLTAIIGNLELLARRVGGDPKAAKFVRAAQRASENGARLTEQLLAFSRRQHLQPQAVDLNAVILGMRDLLARTIGPTIHVRTNLTPDPWPALVDPTQIEIAILNLAINARDAMPLGGTLLIETRNLRGDADPLPGEIGERDCLRVSVTDAGTGMSEEVLRSAIEPFFTTKEPGKGSGLGLSQVYGMVQQSNGSLRIESRLGAGTAVHLYLPRALSATDSAGKPQDRLPHAAPGGRILVVDDDPGVREVTVQMLRQAGYGVAEAESGQAALDTLARGEIYDLIVIDIAMPGLNGIDTMRRARARWPGLRALYVTGYADLAGADSETGQDLLIKKPFHLTELTAMVDRAIKQSRYGDGDNVVPLAIRGMEGLERS